MKLEVIVRIEGRERSFEIPCGLGDKTFKWLGQVASQRYAASAPNGVLRHREGYHGLSDSVQFQAVTITTPSGETPFPADYLHDYLHDGDTVEVELCSQLPVDTQRGTPQTSEYATMAYSVSQESLHHPGLQGETHTASRSAVSMGSFSSSSRSAPETNSAAVSAQEKRAKANFMRIIVKSQMLDEKRVEATVAQHWQQMQVALKLLKSDDSPRIRATFATYWDMLKDVFKYFSKDCPTMLRDQFVNLLEEANVFPIASLTLQSSLAFDRACKLLPSSTADHDHQLTFTSFLLSLLFCAQLKYNDTLDPKVPAARSYEAVTRLVVVNLLPLARRLELHSILRAAFIHEECLVKIRGYYDVLYGYFVKTSTKTRDFPTTISVEEMTELLFQAELLPANTEVHFTRRLLHDVREGTIFGRDVDIDEAEAADFPIAELTLPEFIEVLCRAGYYHFSKNASTMHTNTTGAAEAHLHSVPSFSNLTLTTVSSAGDFSVVKSTADLQIAASDPFQSQIIEFYVNGIVSMCDFIAGKKVKQHTLTKEGKRKKGEK